MRINLTIGDGKMYMSEPYERTEKAKELLTKIDEAIKEFNGYDTDAGNRFRVLTFEMEEFE